MAISKILSRKARLDVGIRYVLNGDKTDNQILTARLNCEEGQEYRQMMTTKQETGKTGGIQFFHIIQSFRPGEVTPEEALEIARELALEHLSEYEVVIGTHVDKEHVHSHILFNSVSTYTGRKYHSTRESYRQIQELSDRLCREHGLSVIEAPEKGSSLSYAEWRRQKLGFPTFRSMLEADVKACIEDANDLGHFYMLLEHRGYEISHWGNRLGFRFRGQERFVCPGRKNPLYTEDGIQRAINGNLEAITAGSGPGGGLPAQICPIPAQPQVSRHCGALLPLSVSSPEHPEAAVPQASHLPDAQGGAPVREIQASGRLPPGTQSDQRGRTERLCPAN